MRKVKREQGLRVRSLTEDDGHHVRGTDCAKDLAIEKLTKFLLAAERKGCRIGPLGEVGAVLDSPFAQLTVSYSTASDSEARWATPPELRRS